ncbi:amidohydrolase [Brachyspira pilosicoli]|uniref:Amidohydrolase n=1 Tax=Brachyspira pilosicoli TaxID=52584 RepID=A0A5C8FC16_BRAPL|nr:amidohydrolase [Brachyspira pilosicoli]TXJ47526.1 amidohydrolase [Brachyspira pilosicoli]
MKRLLYLSILFISVISFICVSCASKKDSNLQVYYNGNIITMEGNTEDTLYAKALEVSNGVITKVAYTDEEANNLIKNKSAVDLKGKTLMPAFIDAHSHIISFAQALTTVDLSGTANVAEIDSRLEDYIKNNNLTNGAWVIGFGYDNNLLPDKKNPTRDDLDKVSTNLAIFITHASGHVGSMNSKALEYFGVDENTPDIEGGVIERYPNSRKPTGYMEEAAFMKYAREVDFKVSDEDMMNFVNQAEDFYLSYGIATAQNSLIVNTDFPLIENMITNNRFKIDIIGFIDLKNAPNIFDEHKDLIGKYSNRFKISGYKIFLDGSPQAKTAWLKEPYITGEKGYRGYPIHDYNTVKEYVRKSFDDKMQLQAHCNGDAAAEQYVDAISEVMTERNTTNNYRAVLVHSQIVKENEYKRMSEFNIIPSLFVAHIYYWGDTHIINLGMERASQISASKTALENNLPFTYHQDTPVIKPNMIETISCALNRTTKDGVLLGKNQKIDALNAFKAITINAAYQNGEEDIKGSLKEGKLADLVILSAAPLKIDSKDMNSIEVLETIKEGKTLYKK